MGRLVNPAANLDNRHQHGVARDGVIMYAADDPLTAAGTRLV
jgi:hypothetical protein